MTVYFQLLQQRADALAQPIWCCSPRLSLLLSESKPVKVFAKEAAKRKVGLRLESMLIPVQHGCAGV